MSILEIASCSCKKATELIEKKQILKLSTAESFKLFTHKLICNECKRYEKQSLKLGLFLNNNSPELENSSLKEKIISKL